MKLKKLLKDLPLHQIRGSKEIEITGISANSKLVAPGNLFVAKKGRSVNGAQFIPEAISAGATAVITDIFDPTLKNVTQIICSDVSSVEGPLAAHYYQFPSEELLMIGITGTNGKTTTSFLIKHLLDKELGPCGLIGTIEYIIGDHRYQATHTTPEVASNHKLLREMLHQRCLAAVTEVTSHALDQGRVSSIDYDVAVFTNLSHEHLDYHRSMEEYSLAKNKLFRLLTREPHPKKKYPKAAIVNSDDSYHQIILRECKAPVITYGIDQPADIQAFNIKLSAAGSKFLINYQGEKVEFSLPLIGRFNIYNSLATIAFGISQHIPLEKIAAAVKTFPCIPGRLEKISNSQELKIYVDFAHTPDALVNVLKCLKELCRGRLLTLFGCGGDRDPFKRPKMAQACEQFSDFCLVTTDNPRSEDPLSIIRQICEGFKSQANYAIELERRKAIERIIRMATPNDIVLIAGRGHEPYQLFAHHTIEFDDRKVVKQFLQDKIELK
jgi:UDP-N-acetylmuramoyl-L-alanyl-D-glutamate--2,6-diaminopimelate ligase